MKVHCHNSINVGFVCHLLQEPLGGAHADPFWASQQIKHAILDAMAVIPSVYGNRPKANSLFRKKVTVLTCMEISANYQRPFHIVSQMDWG